MKEYQVVFVTAKDENEATEISRALVGEGLAACVNVIAPCRSIYQWKGEIVDDNEVLLIVKTKASLFEALEKRVVELHSYDVPEIIAIRLEALSPGYRAFLADVLRK